MTTEFSNGGDPSQTLRLLWRAEAGRRRGPRPRLSVDQIVNAAILLADAEGLSAVSMRRVAEELGVSAMSLYTYVPGKAELVDLMVDAVLGETKQGAEAGDWRERLTAVARENWALHHRHPWLLQVVNHRPVLGPNLIAKYDRELHAVDGIGLTDLEMDSVLSLITGYVQAAARASVAAAEVTRQTGITDQQWWRARAPLLEQVFDADRHPLAARVGAAASEACQAAAPARRFEFGLLRILDGIEMLIQQRAIGSRIDQSSLSAGG